MAVVGQCCNICPNILFYSDFHIKHCDESVLGDGYE